MKKIIRKTKIGWVLTDDTLTAFDKIQATLYHTYELTNRQPFDVMKMKILNSKPDEYNTWADVVDLAIKHGVRGYGTRIPELEKSESDVLLAESPKVGREELCQGSIQKQSPERIEKLGIRE